MSDDVLKQDLIDYFNYSPDQAEYTVIIYGCMCELDDLVAVVEEKKRSCMRL